MQDRVAPLILLVLAFLVAGCADSRAVNAAFSRTRVTWAVFDPAAAEGLRPLAGFEQPLKTAWVPRTMAVYATDLASRPGGGAAAVSHLGLLALDDGDGTLASLRPAAQWALDPYLTDRLFVWKQKVFLTLHQEFPATAPPATLAWWAPGQSRLAFYPIPSQVRDPSRQLAAVAPPAGTSSEVGLVWKSRQSAGWTFEAGSFALDSGTETVGTASGAMPMFDASADPKYAAVRARLAERLGTGVTFRVAEGPGVRLGFTETGWVAVATLGEGQTRLYHLPELGLAGKYTAAVALSRGYVFSWETSYRGFVGAAGLVHVPFAVLAP